MHREIDDLKQRAVVERDPEKATQIKERLDHLEGEIQKQGIELEQREGFAHHGPTSIEAIRRLELESRTLVKPGYGSRSLNTVEGIDTPPGAREYVVIENRKTGKKEVWFGEKFSPDEQARIKSLIHN